MPPFQTILVRLRQSFPNHRQVRYTEGIIEYEHSDRRWSKPNIKSSIPTLPIT